MTCVFYMFFHFLTVSVPYLCKFQTLFQDDINGHVLHQNRVEFCQEFNGHDKFISCVQHMIFTWRYSISEAICWKLSFAIVLLNQVFSIILSNSSPPSWAHFLSFTLLSPSVKAWYRISSLNVWNGGKTPVLNIQTTSSFPKFAKFRTDVRLG